MFEKNDPRIIGMQAPSSKRKLKKYFGKTMARYKANTRSFVGKSD